MCFAHLRATTACTFSTSQLPKVARTPGDFNILTSKCVSCHNSVHFFDISTSKVVRTPQFLTHFTSKCASGHNAMHFFNISISKTPPNPSVLTHFTSKRASRHNAVHFSNISTSKSGPILRCFVPFHFEIGFAPQPHATFHLSSSQMSPHSPL